MLKRSFRAGNDITWKPSPGGHYGVSFGVWSSRDKAIKSAMAPK
jgi:hypothetical protein